MSARGSAWLLPLVLLVGCGGGDTEAADGAGSKAPSAGASEVDGFEVQGEVLTPEEAEAQAEEAITPENADEEFEKLEESIGG